MERCFWDASGKSNGTCIDQTHTFACDGFCSCIRNQYFPTGWARAQPQAAQKLLLCPHSVGSSKQLSTAYTRSCMGLLAAAGHSSLGFDLCRTYSCTTLPQFTKESQDKGQNLEKDQTNSALLWVNEWHNLFILVCRGPLPQILSQMQGSIHLLWISLLVASTHLSKGNTTHPVSISTTIRLIQRTFEILVEKAQLKP